MLSIFTQYWAIAAGSDHWQTMVFTVLTFAQLFQIMAIRSERESLFSIGFGIEPAAARRGAARRGAAARRWSTCRAFNGLLKTQPLTAGELAFCVLLPSLVFVAIEIEKWLARRGVIYRNRPGRPATAAAGLSS